MAVGRGGGRGDAIRGSRVLVPLQLVFAVNGALYGTLLPRYPELAERLDATAGTFGLALMGAGVGGIVGSTAVTWAGRRAGGPARVVALTAPVMVLAVAAAGAAPTVVALFGALVLLGLADGIVDPAMNAVGAAEQRRVGAVFMGRLHATWSAATLTATGIGALVAGLGVGVVPHVLVACGLLLPVHVVASARVVRHGRDLRATAEVAPPLEVDTAPDGVEAQTRGTGRPVIWVATIVVAMAAVLVEIPPQEWAGLLLLRELGTGPGLAGAAPFTFLVGVLAGRVGLDRLVDAHGWRRVGAAAAMTSLVGMSGGLLLGAVTRSPWPVLAGLAVAGAGAAPHFPLLFDRAPAIAARLGLAPDTGAGLIAAVTRAAMLVGPLAIGQIADRAGLFVGLAIVPVLAAVMIPSLLVLLRPGRPD